MKSIGLGLFCVVVGFTDVIGSNFSPKSYPLSARISNGNEARPGQFSYQVGLVKKLNDTGLWCGASVISDEWVLTAAHCVVGDFDGIKLIFGAIDLHTKSFGRHIQFINQVQRNQIIVHSLYDDRYSANDIALVRLSKKLIFSKYIHSIKLPSGYIFQSFINSPAVISGWGCNGERLEQYLKYGYSEVMDLSTCEQFFDPGFIKESNICLKFPKSATVGCQGDSGGPLVSTVTGELIGVMSAISSYGCDRGFPGIYSSVIFYRDWIKEKSGV